MTAPSRDGRISPLRVRSTIRLLEVFKVGQDSELDRALGTAIESFKALLSDCEQLEEEVDASCAIIATERAEVTRLRTQRERDEEALARWQENSRETFDAMCAMRNDLNEMFPMPSLESDLLQGPEASVFFAAVVQAVRDARERDEKVIEAARKSRDVRSLFSAEMYSPNEWRDKIYEADIALDAALAARDAGEGE